MPANYRPLYTRPTFVDESLFGTPNETAVKMSRSMPASVRNGVTVMGAQELSNIGFRAKSKGETGLATSVGSSATACRSSRTSARRSGRTRSRRPSCRRSSGRPSSMRRRRCASSRPGGGAQRREAAARDRAREQDAVPRHRPRQGAALKVAARRRDAGRECQIELKKLKQRQLVQDELWYQKQQDAIRRMDAEEDLRDREEEEKRVLVAKVREEQVQQQRNMHASRVAMTKREGEIMRNAAAEELKVEARQREEAKEEEQRLRAEVRPRRRPPPPTPSPSRRNPPHPRPPARLPTPACPPPRSPPPLPLAPHRASLPPSPTPPNLRLSLPALFLGRDIHPPRAAARSLSLLRLRAPPRSLWRQTTRSWQSARRCSDSPTSRRLRC